MVRRGHRKGCNGGYAREPLLDALLDILHRLILQLLELLSASRLVLLENALARLLVLPKVALPQLLGLLGCLDVLGELHVRVLEPLGAFSLRIGVVKVVWPRVGM